MGLRYKQFLRENNSALLFLAAVVLFISIVYLLS